MTGDVARPLAVLSVLREGEAAPTLRLAGGRLRIRKGEAEWTVEVVEGVDRPAGPAAPLLVVEAP